MNFFSMRLGKLDNIVALRQLIVLFNDMQLHKKTQQKSLIQKICNAIKKVSTSIEQEYYKGRVIRGNIIDIIVNEQSFLNDGDVYLFGSILHKIYSSLADINSYNRVRIIGMEKGAIMEWPACLN
jgi:type VI secretion system protein ImpG